LPADELQKLVVDTTLEVLKTDVRTRTFALKCARRGEIARRQFLRAVIRRVEVTQRVIWLHLDGASCWLDQPSQIVVRARLADHRPIVVETPALYSMPIVVDIPINPASKCGAMASLRGESRPEPVDPHQSLIKAVVRGFLWRTQLLSGAVKTMAQPRKKVGFRRDYSMRILRLGFVAPDLTEVRDSASRLRSTK